MSWKADRHKKTTARNLGDLDDHLHFLSESLDKAFKGDLSYLKSVAGELRNLVCFSGGTEGLLFRMISELNFSDEVYVKSPKGTDLNNPLTRGLKLFIMPIMDGSVDEQGLESKNISLRKLVKEYAAVHFEGKDIIREHLISWISQQVGSAHEDERVGKLIIELSRTSIGGQPALRYVLSSIAYYVIDVGRKLLEFAEINRLYVAKGRSSPKINFNSVQDHAFVVSENFESVDQSVSESGTIIVRKPAPRAGWHSDGEEYFLMPDYFGGLILSYEKHRNNTFSVTIIGLNNKIYIKTIPLKDNHREVVSVGISWSKDTVLIDVSGK